MNDIQEREPAEETGIYFGKVMKKKLYKKWMKEVHKYASHSKETMHNESLKHFWKNIVGKKR